MSWMKAFSILIIIFRLGSQAGTFWIFYMKVKLEERDVIFIPMFYNKNEVIE
jgi:hypothetical protein